MITYRAKHILLEDEEDAQEMLELLDQGSLFEDLAREFSECDSCKDGGDLGRFVSGSMVAEFERALSKMEINQVSKPVKSKFGLSKLSKCPTKGYLV